MQQKMASAGKGKEAPYEKVTKCYKLPMSNEKGAQYLNTTR